MKESVCYWKSHSGHRPGPPVLSINWFFFVSTNSKKTLILRQHTKRSEASMPALLFSFSVCGKSREIYRKCSTIIRTASNAFWDAFFACSDSAMYLQMSASEPTEAILTVLSPESEAWELCELCELEALLPQAPRTNTAERVISDLTIVFNFI